ncbi:hypothetical protein PTI98_011599 [Pleurotus ostreatus]|nr:hypothetical protein PTI98_011599 [Pleurotus ostreatus]
MGFTPSILTSAVVPLLEVGWWPSSPLEPQTATTFPLLRLFHNLNLQGCLPATDFYRSLEQLHNGGGLDDPPGIGRKDRLQQFMLTVREWRHIRMAKRAGRGQDPSGLDATAQGALSIPCRSCPHPGINLPQGWESASPGRRWLYGLILQEDANFKQKSWLRSADNRDPALGPGWATFVAGDTYFDHLSKYVDPEEINHCVGFAALWSANTRRSKGLRATGIGSVSCARSDMFRANGIGDLQKGERYANMDYIFLSSIMATSLFLVTITYDIACQWYRNFFTRMTQLPSALQLSSRVDLRFRIPKFHLAAHKESCHAPFSLNYTKWVGRTNGEGVERMWSWLNKVSHSVSMMGQGGCQDTLDDFCNFWNWRKTVNLGDSLLKKMTLAIPQAAIHHQVFCVFTDGLHEQHSEELLEWENQVRAWELDHDQPCPFDLPRDDLTMSDLKKEMAEEEHRRVQRGEALPGDTSPSNFIITGLDIEAAQQELLVTASKHDLTTVEATQLQTSRTALLKKIKKF